MRALLLVAFAACGEPAFSIDVTIAPVPATVTAVTVNGDPLVLGALITFHRDYAGGYASIPSDETLVFQFSTASGAAGTIESVLQFCAKRCASLPCQSTTFEHEAITYTPSADFLQLDTCASCSGEGDDLNSCS